MLTAQARPLPFCSRFRLMMRCAVPFFLRLVSGFLMAVVGLSMPAKAEGQHAPDCVIAAFYPPFVIADTIENAGFSIDIIRAAAARAGREISIEILPFQRALHRLQSNSSCMMPALFRNSSREAKFRWIETYHAAELSFLSLNAPIHDLQQGRHLARIAVETDASADRFLTGLGFENLVRISNPASSARMLHAGRIDAWAQSATAALELWEDLKLAPELHASAPIYSVPVYVTAGLDYPDDLVEIYRRAIHSIIADGTVGRLIAQYE